MLNLFDLFLRRLVRKVGLWPGLIGVYLSILRGLLRGFIFLNFTYYIIGRTDWLNVLQNFDGKSSSTSA